MVRARVHGVWQGAVVVLLAVACACGGGGGLSTRYALEKALYDARQLELRAYAVFPADDYDAWQTAVNAYQTVERYDLSLLPDGSTLRSDCEHVQLEARIGELRLRHLDYRWHDAVTHAATAGTTIPGWTNVPWRDGLPMARALYDSLGPDPRGAECRRLMRSVAGDRALWAGTELFRDSLLVIPLSLASTALDAGAEAGAFVAFADSFYSSITNSWPDSAVAGAALAYQARLRATAGRFDDALGDVERALGRDDLSDDVAPGLRLLQGQLLAFAVHDTARARVILTGVVLRYPDTSESSNARLCLSMLGREGAPPDAETVAALHALEEDDRVSDDVASEALLLHAVSIESSGQWDDASAMLWDIVRIYPYTPSALAAPLRIIRHHVAMGEHEDAARAANKASKFYLDLIRRDSALIHPRNITKDFFVEANLQVGSAAGAAQRLEEASSGWNSDSAAVARLKSALIYNYILGERENGVGIMQKSLALFSRSRYLRATRRELVRIAPARGADTDTDTPGGSR